MSWLSGHNHIWFTDELEISANISTLVFAELLVPAYRVRESKYAEKVVHILSNYPNLKIIPLTTEISTTAAKLHAIHTYQIFILSNLLL